MILLARSAKLSWYVRRISRMSPGEIAWRVREQALRRAWSRRQVRPGQVAALASTAAGGGTPVHVGAPGGRRVGRP